MRFLFDSGSSVNIINQDTFKKLESLISLILERSFSKIYPYGCENPLPIFGKRVVEIYSNCTKKRIFVTFHVIDAAASCILGKSLSELFCVLSVLKCTRYEQISTPTNSDFKYILNSLYEYKDIFEGTDTLEIFELNIHIDHSVQPYVQNQEGYHFS